MQAAGGSTHTSPSPEEIEKKLNIYHKGAKIWKMLIFCQVGLGPFWARSGVGVEDATSVGVHVCAHEHVWGAEHGQIPRVRDPPADHSLLQGGPGHLYLLKNKVATFAKVEKEEDMIQ